MKEQHPFHTTQLTLLIKALYEPFFKGFGSILACFRETVRAFSIETGAFSVLGQFVRAFASSPRLMAKIGTDPCLAFV
jgi:hypothetical protein